MSLLQEFRQGVRRLSKSPWSSALSIVTLALAIGAHAAMFNLVDVLFLRPLPVEDPDELVGVYESRDGSGFHPLSLPDYRDYREAVTVFEGLAAHYSGAPLMLQLGQEPQQEINGSVVSPNYFTLLGVEPGRGRFFRLEESTPPGAHPVAVVSYDLWQSRLGGGEDVLGKVIKLNDTAFTVIGVAPPGFEGVQLGLPSDVWIPTAMSAVGYRWCETSDRDCTWIEMIGRLAPARTMEEAHAEMEVLSRRIRDAHPSNGERERGLALAPLTGVEPEIRGERLRLTSLLLAAVTLVLVVAGANVSGLLIARSLTRRKELALRVALGAPRRRVVFLLMVDTLLLAVAGGIAGLFAAKGFGRLLGLLFPSAVPLELGVDLRIAAYTLGLSVVVGLLVGLVPGIQAARPSLVPALKDGPALGRMRRPRLLSALVVVQIGLSFVLLTATGLLVRSLQEVHQVGTVDPDRVATFRLRPRLIGYGPERAQPFTREVVARLSSLPAVETATPVAGVPPPFWYDGPYPAHRPDDAVDPDRAPGAFINQVGPGFFEAFSLAILRGRDFDERDTADSTPATVVNRSLATTLWPDDDAVGRFLVLGDERFEVVGVVEDPPEYGNEEQVPLAFLNYWQNPGNVDARIAVRTAGAAEPLLPVLSEEIHAINPSVPVVGVGTMRDELQRVFGQTYLTGRVLGVAGGMTLFLSAVGLFGVVALAVAQRGREIAIRRALGGGRGHVVGLVVRETLVLAVVALVLGLGLSILTSRAVAHYLYGISPYDPFTFMAAVVVLALVALLASWWPARRASRIDPMTALKDA